ncbi:hypothetical protein [Dapis sp. BLCC M229]|uniref:hypothetical protein n=1 Tax=Dapis sp. BLCC M229 TaxID=3400188 RepID=UPI003CF9BD4B
MQKHDLTLEDLQIANNLKGIANIFEKLGYNTTVEPLSIEELELPTKSFQAVKDMTVSLKPWHDVALWQWLEDCSFPSNKEVREKITNVTGNWSFLLQKFYQLANSEPSRWQDALDNLEQQLQNPEFVREVYLSMGFDNSQPQRQQVLKILAELGEESVEDLIELVDDIPLDDAIFDVLERAVENLLKDFKRQQSSSKLRPKLNKLLQKIYFFLEEQSNDLLELEYREIIERVLEVIATENLRSIEREIKQKWQHYVDSNYINSLASDLDELFVDAELYYQLEEEKKSNPLEMIKAEDIQLICYQWFKPPIVSTEESKSIYNGFHLGRLK